MSAPTLIFTFIENIPLMALLNELSYLCLRTRSTSPRDQRISLPEIFLFGKWLARQGASAPASTPLNYAVVWRYAVHTSDKGAINPLNCSRQDRPSERLDAFEQ